MLAPRSLGLLVDVDGVVTDGFARADDEVLRLLADLAARGCGLAFITGRSRGWLEGQLLPRLLDLATDGPGWGDRVVLACEMGAERSVGLRSGRWAVEAGLAVPAKQRRALRRLARPFAGLIDWDASKRITATVEAAHAPDDPVKQGRSREAMRAWAESARAELDARFGVHQSTYAVDVLGPGLTKALGARFALARFRSAGELTSVFVLGDGASDIAMAATARDQAVGSVRFTWLGAPPAPAVPGVDVVLASAPNCAGTRLVLQGMRASLSAQL